MDSRIFDDEQIKLLSKKTPKDKLQEYKTLNGDSLTGVDWSYFKNLLNEVLGAGNWGYEPLMEHLRYEKTSSNHASFCVPVRCYIYGKGKRIVETVIVDEANDVAKDIVIYEPNNLCVWECTNIGTAFFERQMLQGDLIKAAIADGVKKTFSVLGFCQDVYEGKTVLEKTETQSKKKNPRTGTSKIKTAEDKEKVKEAKKALKDFATACQKQIIEKQETGEKITKMGQKALEFDNKIFLQLANEALMKAVSEGDPNVEFDINEKINRLSDLYTLHEWKLALAMTKKWFNMILQKEGLLANAEQDT